MRVDHIAAAVIGTLIGRLVRRALVIAISGICLAVALYHVTIAGTLALDDQFNAIDARLVVGGIYALVGVVALGIFWQMGKSSSADGKALAAPRQMQLVMLIEAVMLGYQLARKREPSH